MNKHLNFYAAYLYEEYSSHIFNDEIDRKRFLDIIRAVLNKNKSEIYAFCLLEHEVYMLLDIQDLKLTKLILNQMSQEYLHYKQVSTLTFCSSFEYKKEMTVTDLLEYCRNIHMLPVERKLVKELEDYWWSSYRNYIKKYSVNMVNTSILIALLDENETKAVSKFRKFHENRQKANHVI